MVLLQRLLALVDADGLRQPRRPPLRTRWTPPHDDDPGPKAA
jgi:hypothetical protein